MVGRLIGPSLLTHGRSVTLLGLSAVLAFSAVAVAGGTVAFDGSPGKNAPPATLGGMKMSKFKADRRRLNRLVSLVRGPTGNVLFSQKLSHFRIRRSSWQTWSNRYRGDVYFASGRVTITLPSGTDAFYLYAEPNDRRRFRITATAAGVSSGAVPVVGNGGAKYFGFFATGGVLLTSVTVSSKDVFNKRKHQQGGFAVGEFGIHGAQP